VFMDAAHSLEKLSSTPYKISTQACENVSTSTMSADQTTCRQQEGWWQKGKGTRTDGAEVGTCIDVFACSKTLWELDLYSWKK